jgi:phospholipid transport system substrate-binding protein
VSPVETNTAFRGKLRNAQTTAKPARVLHAVERTAQPGQEAVDELRHAPESRIRFNRRHNPPMREILSGAERKWFQTLLEVTPPAFVAQHAMSSMSRVWGFLLAAAFMDVPIVAAPSGVGPRETAQALCDALVTVMKQGRALGFKGRRAILDPELRRDLNLPLMTRLVVGPPWRAVGAAERSALVEAFSDYSIALYASRFKDYSGEHFVVDPEVTRLDSGDVIVHTRLVLSEGDPVQLDYLMRGGPGGWGIIDVFLSGTISELATRRSEYSATLRAGGAPALTQLLRQKTAQIGD